MKGNLSWSIFWALVGIFVVIVSGFFIPAVRELLMGLPFIIISGAVFFLLGVALIFLTVKEKVRGLLKKFLLLTGASVYDVSVNWTGCRHNVMDTWGTCSYSLKAVDYHMKEGVSHGTRDFKQSLAS